MSEGTFEDFLNIIVDNLQKFLTIRGIFTSGYRKPELVAQTFYVRETNLLILESTEEQNEILKQNYLKELVDLKLKDTKQILVVQRIDDITTWPPVSLGNIFEYILNLRAYNTEYVG